jgi:hypothetical protein
VLSSLLTAPATQAAAEKAGWENLRPVLQEAVAKEMQASAGKDPTNFGEDLKRLDKLCACAPELEALSSGVLPGLVTFQLSLPVKVTPPPSAMRNPRIVEPPSITPWALGVLYAALAAHKLDDQVRAPFH